MKVLYYSKANGKSPVKDYINGLNLEDRTKLLGCLKSIEDLGFDSPRVEFRQIEAKLWEIKIKLSSGGHRIFYVIAAKDTMVLLHAFKKQSQKTPKKEIAIAYKRMFEVTINEN